MRLLIISGMSGSGKSIALQLLEDLGFYCSDNLPLPLLPAFAQQIASQQEGEETLNAAVGIDARNLNYDFEQFNALIMRIRERGIPCSIFFLTANDVSIVKRFSETRRRHPLTRDNLSLNDAINAERALLAPMAGEADLIIDTSETNVHQLRELLRDWVQSAESRSLSLLFQSFAFKHGVPADADFVFDMRCLPNPHWQTDLRPYSGLDQPVADFLQKQEMVEGMAVDVRRFLDTWIPKFEAENRSYLTVAFGCTGGKHRSVYMNERMAACFRGGGRNIIVRHRDLEKNK